MKYIHVVVVVNRFDLLDRAIESIQPLWPYTSILDNSPQGNFHLQCDWPIDVVRPAVPLTCAQSMMFIHRRAKGCDAWGYQHNDAVMRPGQAEKYYESVVAAAASRVKWASICTENFKPNGDHRSHDIVSAYNPAAVEDIGPWDWHFPQPNYHIDLDWFYRARLKGYEIIHSPAEVDHLEGGSCTIQDPYLNYVNGVKIAYNDDYYMKKWGGPPHLEKFKTAFNRSCF